MFNRIAQGVILSVSVCVVSIWADAPVEILGSSGGGDGVEHRVLQSAYESEHDVERCLALSRQNVQQLNLLKQQLRAQARQLEGVLSKLQVLEARQQVSLKHQPSKSKVLKHRSHSISNQSDLAVNRSHLKSQLVRPVKHVSPRSQKNEVKSPQQAQALSLESNRFNTVYHHGLAALQSQRLQEAADLFQTYLKQAPQGHYVPETHYQLGLIAMKSEFNDEAFKHFNILAQRFKSFKHTPDAYFKCALIYWKQGQSHQAHQYLQQLIQRYPQSASAYMAQLKLRQWVN